MISEHDSSNGRGSRSKEGLRTCGENPYMAAIVTTRQSSGRLSRGTPKDAPLGLAGGEQQAAALGLASHSLRDAEV